MLESLKKFLEAGSSVLDNVLSSWLKPSAVNSAKEKYSSLESTRDGQLKILSAARSGEEDAVIYLYDQYLPLIRKVYWKYFIGPNKNYGKDKFQQEAVYDFISTAYEMLAGHGETSPYKTFNPDKFSVETNIVKQFSYYFFRYLQNEAIKLARSMTKGAFSNAKLNSEDSPEEKVSVSSYEDYLDNSTETATDDHAEAVTLRVMLNDFKDWLEANKDDKYTTVWNMKFQGYSMAEIAKALGLPREQYARVLWNKIRTWFLDKNPNARDFLN